MSILIVSIYLSLGMTLVSALLLLVRFFIGPHVLDRALMVEVLTLMALCVLGLSSILYEDSSLINLAIVLSVIPFIASVALCQFVGGKEGGLDRESRE